MELELVLNVLKRVHGATFASLNAETKPSPGIRCVTTGEQVILFTNKNVSGYNEMVRRRLKEAGKDPDLFVLGDLPWGERVPGTPLVYHRGTHYLQCIVLSFGESRYFIGNREISDPSGLGLRNYRPSQGLPKGREVYVHTYSLANITRLALAGEVLVASKDDQAILRV